MATNEQVVEHFASRNEGDINAANMFVREGVLYSYGTHWPLAVWDDGIAYVNGDRRSQTSTVHVGLATKALTRAGAQFRMSTLSIVKGMIG